MILIYIPFRTTLIHFTMPRKMIKHITVNHITKKAMGTPSLALIAFYSPTDALRSSPTRPTNTVTSLMSSTRA